MPRSNEAGNSQLPAGPDQQGWRHWGDGLAGKLFGARLQGFYPTAADYRDVQVDANGVVQVASSGGGGGAVTIADGADVAQGATTDASSASTLVGLLKAIKAAVQGTLSVSGSLGRTWTLGSGTDSVSVGNFPGTQAISAALLPLPTGAATDASLATLLSQIGAASVSSLDIPTTSSVLTELQRIRKAIEAQQKLTAQLVALQTPKVAPRAQPTLLHRS